MSDTDWLIGATGPVLFAVWTIVAFFGLRDLRRERAEQLRRKRVGDQYVLPRSRRVLLLAVLWLCMLGLAVSSLTTWVPILPLDVLRVVTSVVRLVSFIAGVSLLWSWLRDEI